MKVCVMVAGERDGGGKQENKREKKGGEGKERERERY